MAVTDYAGAMDWIDATIKERGRGYVTAAAVHLIMVAREDPPTREAVLGASLVLPDGQPLVWALRALGHRSATRVYGPDLMAAYCHRAATIGRRMYLYGGRTEAALAQLIARLREQFPGIRIVGGYSPPFRPLDEEEERRIIEDINGCGAEVVWVGTGQPKQEHWMHAMSSRLQAPVLVGVGAAFDFHAGLVAQAPAWMQRSGLEWTFRLSREPRRLWRRYWRYNPRFVGGFARQYWGHLRRDRSHAPTHD
jgi:N-acetylglucosaminyldiphosphoundecaprenol N-acetyl-beta-D-mannosaminyltransferase